MKVVINACFGGFGLSEEAFEWLIENKGWKVTEYNEDSSLKDKSAQIVRHCECIDLIGKYSLVDRGDINIRTSSDLVECVETLGDAVNNTFSLLKVMDIPDNVEWEIEEYDGNEWVSEKHRRWC